MLMREAVPRSGGEGAVRSAGRGVLCSAEHRAARCGSVQPCSVARRKALGP